MFLLCDQESVTRVCSEIRHIRLTLRNMRFVLFLLLGRQSQGPAWPLNSYRCRKSPLNSLRNDNGNAWLFLAKHGNQDFLECCPSLGMAWMEFCSSTGRPRGRRCVRIVQCVCWEFVESLSSCLWGFPSPSASLLPIKEESYTAEREFPPHLFHYNTLMSVGQEFPALVTEFLRLSVFPVLINRAPSGTILYSLTPLLIYSEETP